ncbi:hypothetical protein AVEN_86386-1, partial [Araneus ventricosus]
TAALTLGTNKLGDHLPFRLESGDHPSRIQEPVKPIFVAEKRHASDGQRIIR